MNLSQTTEYRVWASMKQRCLNQNSTRYARYGGRGIVICDQWKNDFQAFLNDMGMRPSPGHSLDRIDNDGNYTPDNCRWATRSEQQRNKAKYQQPGNQGANHWAHKDRDRARAIGRANIRKAHKAGEENGRAKLTPRTAADMRALYQSNSDMTMGQLGSIYGVGRETARKVIRRLLW